MSEPEYRANCDLSLRAQCPAEISDAPCAAYYCSVGDEDRQPLRLHAKTEVWTQDELDAAAESHRKVGRTAIQFGGYIRRADTGHD